MKKNIILTIIILFLLVGASLFLANLSMPDSTLYPLKRLEEKVVLKSKITPSDKLAYNVVLLDRRLTEMAYIVQNREYEYYYSSSLRYATTAGDSTNLILANFLKSQASSTNKIFKKHQVTLKKFLVQKENHDEWKFVQDDINYLIIYSNKLSQFT